IDMHISAGRYICGEETGLISALEGRRANPRTKPPFPPVAGFLGQPTIVNNVETLCNVPPIVEHGAAWFKGLSLTSDAGTKLYGASGRVKRPGLWELPLGTPVREVLEDPLRFLARQGRRMLAEPRAIAAKSWGYAKYDAVQLLNEVIDALGLSESAVERLIARLMAVPAARALRLKRAVRLLVAGAEPAVVRGTYQSPILIQWQPARRRARTLEISLTRFR
ncbi:MAG: hypothetical protein ACOY3Y_05710, partial [Acidobacteriota bacterium]